MAIDNTLSPLSYTFAPNVTKEISTIFKRPVTQGDRFIEVTASVLEQTLTDIVLQAEVRNGKGKLAATTGLCINLFASRIAIRSRSN